jgi:small GTP-binding protein
MEFKLKVILVGDFACGKTSILKRIKDEAFMNSYSSTIGIDYIKKSFNHNDLFNDTTVLDDGKTVFEITSEETMKYFKPKNPLFKKYHNINKRISREDILYSLSIWDTSGQEQFSQIINAYYRNITAAIFVFDLSNYKSFKSIESWHKNLYEKLDEQAHGYFPFIVVGNKCDLKSLRTISYNDAEDFVSKLGGVYLETSAKNNVNIQSIFMTLIKSIIFNINHELVIPSIKNGITIFYQGEDIFPRESVFSPNEEDESSQKCCNIM